MELKFNLDVLKEFAEEINETIDAIQIQLTQLSKETDNTAIIEELFRQYHSLKGAFGFIELEPLIQFCHNVEHILDCLRNNKFNINSTIIQQLQQATDIIFSVMQVVDDKQALFTKLELIEEFSTCLKDSIMNEGENNDKMSTAKTKNIFHDVSVHSVDASSLRINLSTVNSLINYVGELVLIRNRLNKLSNVINDEDLFTSVTNLDHIVASLQTSTLNLRMQSISRLFKRYSRLVRTLSLETKKDIKLVLQGEDTKLDKNLLEILLDPLTHLVRNCIDHGIEKPEDRLKIGKPSHGTIKLRAYQEGEIVYVVVEDDGSGMNPAMLKQKAHDKALMEPEAIEKLSDDEAIQLIFTPGFSTCNTVSSISGRGVGMDVVRHRIHQINGSIEVSSNKGKGSKFVIKVPVTLAILNTLMFYVDKQIYAIPVNAIIEIINYLSNSVQQIENYKFFHYRADIIPLIFMHEFLKTDLKQDFNESVNHIIILKIGTEQCAVVVDQIIGQEEVVVKPLSKNLPDSLGIFGATITADGNIAMVMDVTTLNPKPNNSRNF